MPVVVGEEAEPRNINCVFLAVEHDWMLRQSCGPRASLEADAITPHLRPARSRALFVDLSYTPVYTRHYNAGERSYEHASLCTHQHGPSFRLGEPSRMGKQSRQ